MKTKNKLLGIVLGALLFLQCVLPSIQLFNLHNGETKGIYNGSFIAYAEGEDNGIGDMKYMTSKDNKYLLVVTALTIDVTQYKEIGYYLSIDGGLEETFKSDTYYTGVSVKTGADSSKTYEMADIFGDGLTGMIVDEFDYDELKDYSVRPYAISNDDEKIEGASGQKDKTPTYAVTLTNATITKADGEATTATSFKAGTVITVKANVISNKTIVSWLKDGVAYSDAGANNTFDYTMTENAVSFAPVYQDILQDNVLCAISSGTIIPNFASATADAISDESDSDLQGLHGASYLLPANQTATSTYKQITNFDTLTAGSQYERKIKILVKNTGNYDVEMSIYSEFYGNKSSTGTFTAKKGEVTTQFIDIMPGVRAASDIGLAIESNIGGTAEESVKLDIVSCLIAKDTTVIATNSNPVQFSSQSTKINETNTGWTIGGATYDKNIGTAIAYTKGSNVKANDVSLGLTVSNYPEDTGVVYIYAKFTNLVNVGEDAFSFDFMLRDKELNMNKADDGTKKIYVQQTVSFTTAKESQVYKFRIQREDLTKEFYAGIRFAKDTNADNNKNYNVLVQLSYDNMFEYEAQNYGFTATNSIVTKVDKVVNPDKAGDGKYYFEEGSIVTLLADDAPSGKTLVGWMKDGTEFIDNASSVLTVTTTDEDVSYAPVYKDIVLNNALTNFAFSGVTVDEITDTTDDDLQGLLGHKYIFPGNQGTATKSATTTKIDTFTSSNIRTKGVKLIVKNHSNYDVSFSLTGEYFGAQSTSGVITAKANSVTVANFNVDPGVKSSAGWKFAITKAFGGTSSETVELDIVSCLYEVVEGNMVATATGDYAELYADTSSYTSFRLGTANTGNTFTPKFAQISTNKDLYYIRFDGSAKDSTSTYKYTANDASISFKVKDMPKPINSTTGEVDYTLDTAQSVDIYVKVTNLLGVSTYPGYSFDLMLRDFEGNMNKTNENYDTTYRRIEDYASTNVSFTECKQSFVYKFTITRKRYTGSNTSVLKTNNGWRDFYIGTHFTANSSATSSNVFFFTIQVAYENVFGETPIVIQQN